MKFLILNTFVFASFFLLSNRDYSVTPTSSNNEHERIDVSSNNDNAMINLCESWKKDYIEYQKGFLLQLGERLELKDQIDADNCTHQYSAVCDNKIEEYNNTYNKETEYALNVILFDSNFKENNCSYRLSKLNVSYQLNNDSVAKSDVNIMSYNQTHSMDPPKKNETEVCNSICLQSKEVAKNETNANDKYINALDNLRDAISIIAKKNNISHNEVIKEFRKLGPYLVIFNIFKNITFTEKLSLKDTMKLDSLFMEFDQNNFDYKYAVKYCKSLKIECDKCTERLNIAAKAMTYKGVESTKNPGQQ